MGPKSSILIGFSTINHPFWGTPPLFLEIHPYTNNLHLQVGGAHVFSWRPFSPVGLPEVAAQCTSPLRRGFRSGWPVASSFGTLGGKICRFCGGWLVNPPRFRETNRWIMVVVVVVVVVVVAGVVVGVVVVVVDVEATKRIWPKTWFSKDVHQISWLVRRMQSFPLARVFECWIFSEIRPQKVLLCNLKHVENKPFAIGLDFFLVVDVPASCDTLP